MNNEGNPATISCLFQISNNGALNKNKNSTEIKINLEEVNRSFIQKENQI